MPNPGAIELEDLRSSRKARGLRLETIRQSLHLSRNDFAEKLGVSRYTIQNWEINKNGGLSEDRARHVVKALKGMGIQCSFEWLMHGIGLAPTVADLILGEITLSQQPKLDRSKETDEFSLIAAELRLFREHYPGKTIDLVVADDGMEPKYNKGDYVAGIKYVKNQITHAVGYDCIVQTADNDLLLRQVKKGSLEGHYTLVCTNYNTSVVKPLLYDVQLVMAAPVVWMRKSIHKK